jgi:hypothetical protein
MNGACGAQNEDYQADSPGSSRASPRGPKKEWRPVKAAVLNEVQCISDFRDHRKDAPVVKVGISFPGALRVTSPLFESQDTPECINMLGIVQTQWRETIGSGSIQVGLFLLRTLLRIGVQCRAESPTDHSERCGAAPAKP